MFRNSLTAAKRSKSFRSPGRRKDSRIAWNTPPAPVLSLSANSSDRRRRPRLRRAEWLRHSDAARHRRTSLRRPRLCSRRLDGKTWISAIAGERTPRSTSNTRRETARSTRPADEDEPAGRVRRWGTHGRAGDEIDHAAGCDLAHETSGATSTLNTNAEAPARADRCRPV